MIVNAVFTINIKEDFLQERNKYLLKSFPTRASKIPEKFSEINFDKSIHIIATSLSYRKLAKDIAIDLVYKFLEASVCKYPPIYLTKARFIEGYRESMFNGGGKIERWVKAPIIVFDGIDECRNANEMNWVASFISPLISDEHPLILISSNNLTESVLQEYGAMSFGIQLIDIEVLNLNE